MINYIVSREEKLYKVHDFKGYTNVAAHMHFRKKVYFNRN